MLISNSGVQTICSNQIFTGTEGKTSYSTQHKKNTDKNHQKKESCIAKLGTQKFKDYRGTEICDR